MSSTKTKPRTIDEYLAGVNADQRAALEKLRKTIRTVAPKAEECISYGLAAFRLNGRPLVAFGAWANHCGVLSDEFRHRESVPGPTQRFRDLQRHDPLRHRQTVADAAGEEAGQGTNRGERRLTTTQLQRSQNGGLAGSRCARLHDFMAVPPSQSRCRCILACVASAGCRTGSPHSQLI
jgi:hypothetical protein